MNDLMLYHRWLARMVWFQVIIHAAAYTALYVYRSRLSEAFEEAYWNWGVAVGVLSTHLIACTKTDPKSRSHRPSPCLPV